MLIVRAVAAAAAIASGKVTFAIHGGLPACTSSATGVGRGVVTGPTTTDPSVISSAGIVTRVSGRTQIPTHLRGSRSATTAGSGTSTNGGRVGSPSTVATAGHGPGPGRPCVADCPTYPPMHGA